MMNAQDSVWYVDPPYPSGADKYEHNLDFDRFAELLLHVKGFVALSGINDEWDHLGWPKHQFSTYVSLSPTHKPGKTGRTEMLWTNRPTKSVDQLDLF